MEDSEILILILWIVFTLAVASFAHRRGRSYIAWLIVGLLVSPLIAFIAVAVMEPGTEGSVPYRTCPFCTERIKAEAKVCRYCGRELPANQHQGRVQDRSEPVVLPFPKLAVIFLVVLACLIGLGVLLFTVHASGQTFLGI